MIFNTAWFLLFFLIVYPTFLAIPWAGARFAFILLASAVFHYHFAGPAGVTPIIVIGACTFAFGIVVSRLEPGRRRRWVYLLAIAVPTLALVGYKYRELLLPPGVRALGLPGHGAAQVALPLAISFFAFEFVHYLTDVYRGSAPIRNPLRFAFFSIFFPSIVSGPIKRYQPFLSQVRTGMSRPETAVALGGAAQVLLGFFKKLVVADNVTLAIELVEKRSAPSRTGTLLLLFLLSVRILFDFSGYSDIAIGLARLIGIELPRNFRFPYIARNLSEFWQRWHISLSQWIRDYIYIPLGGGRGGLLAKGGNLFVAMFLCGLWHGPAWHFGFWGLYHGFGLTTHGVWERSRPGRWFATLPGSRWAGMVVTDAFVAVGWLIFFYPVDRAVILLRALAGGRTG